MDKPVCSPSASVQLKLGMVLLFPALNLAVVLIVTGADALPAWLAAYARVAWLFGTLAFLNLTGALFLLPLFASPTPLLGTRQAKPASGNPYWREAVYYGSLVAILALPFLLIASRVAPLAAWTVPRTAFALLLFTALLLLTARMTGRWYYPVACSVFALPALVDYLAIDVIGADASTLLTLSPPGILLGVISGDSAVPGGLAPDLGLLLYLLLFVGLAVLPPHGG